MKKGVELGTHRGGGENLSCKRSVLAGGDLLLAGATDQPRHELRRVAHALQQQRVVRSALRQQHEVAVQQRGDVGGQLVRCL